MSQGDKFSIILSEVDKHLCSPLTTCKGLHYRHLRAQNGCFNCY